MTVEVTREQAEFLAEVLHRFIGTCNAEITQIQSQCPPSAGRVWLVKDKEAIRAKAQELEEACRSAY